MELDSELVKVMIESLGWRIALLVTFLFFVATIIIGILVTYLNNKLKTDYQSAIDKQHAKYQAQLNNVQAKLDAKLEAGTHITKEKYDLELRIYQELWAKASEILHMFEILPSEIILSSGDTEQQRTESINNTRRELLALIKDFTSIVKTHAPFYSPHVFVASTDFVTAVSNYQQLFPKSESQIDAFMKDKARSDFVETSHKIQIEIRKRLNDVLVI